MALQPIGDSRQAGRPYGEPVHLVKALPGQAAKLKTEGSLGRHVRQILKVPIDVPSRGARVRGGRLVLEMKNGFRVQILRGIEAGYGGFHIPVDRVGRINEAVAQQIGDRYRVECRLAPIALQH